MPKLLEVIVTSVEEARTAEAGGADRLELVRNLADGGLTPAIDTIRQVLDSVSLPVRVMVRENTGMTAGCAQERQHLNAQAQAVAQLPVSGLVLGFVEHGVIDLPAMRDVLQHTVALPVTFHRAFEHLTDPADALAQMLEFPQIDRVLVRASARLPLAALEQWQQLPRPSSESPLRFIAGIGLSRHLLNEIRQSTIDEVHVGRLVRQPAATWGRLDPAEIAALKSALA